MARIPYYIYNPEKALVEMKIRLGCYGCQYWNQKGICNRPDKKEAVRVNEAGKCLSRKD